MNFIAQQTIHSKTNKSKVVQRKNKLVFTSPLCWNSYIGKYFWWCLCRL